MHTSVYQIHESIQFTTSSETEGIKIVLLGTGNACGLTFQNKWISYNLRHSDMK